MPPQPAFTLPSARKLPHPPFLPKPHSKRAARPVSAQPRRKRAVTTTVPRAEATAPPAGTSFASLFAAQDAQTAVQTASGATLSLPAFVAAQTAAGRPVLLGWLRHYGCTLCKKQARDWARLAPRLAECSDGRLVVALVGNGSVAQAAAFRGEVSWPGELFSDPANGTYRVLGFRRGVGVTFTLEGLGKVVRSRLEGNRQTWLRMPTDPFQQGGAVLVGADGVVRLFHADEFAGDHAELETIVDAVCEAC